MFRPIIVWNGDVDKLAVIDQQKWELDPPGFTNRFYGLALGPIGIGVWIRRRAKQVTR